ncbi:phosphate/phosphite/phosphonate ABC transporter substrate-binding protein [Pseudoxanthomonas sp.]|uniref:phosphate/phosphite/phosphonate ABC transporter substrate-binding protein n=1 Tax=Pseudoxanthomonas sp. TaxID=1871049 RepID=UPI00258F1DFF|nr:phosphate/phosphite/phosphonate ABC transporter substrate-binding protein [Pseudoxanthomonas sp.]MCR6685051.1 phosphate/phosphite/phosphonate ABC transporter substrate-binding protein [Pseudoxanthomonas sp.]
MKGAGRSSSMRAWVRSLCCLLLLAASVPAARAAEDAHVLVLGRISDDPRAHYDQLKALLDYVVPRMREVGITEGRVLMARDPQQMASYLRRGRVDWVTETASTAVQLQQRADARPLLLTERNGVSRYHTVFFAHRDSPVRDLPGLRGHTLALQSTASTSAYMVPMTTLLDAGLKPEILLGPGDRPAPDRVGYVFARTEANIAVWVQKRMVDAGALSSLDWNDPQRMPPAFKADLQVVHETPAYPRAVELVRDDLPAPVEARLREVLLQAAADPEAGQALHLFFNTSRFLPLDEDSRQALAELRDGVARVRAEVE